MSFRGRAGFLPVVLASAASATLVYLTIGSPWHITVGAFGGILYAAFARPNPEVPA